MIGGGLALNDTGFYTGSGNVPYVQFESVGDFIPEPRCFEVCSGVTNEKKKDGGYKRSGWTLVRGAESDGSSAMCYVFERVLKV